MPTPLPSGEKDAFIAIVNVASYPGGPLTASYLQDNMNNYEDVAEAIYQQLDYFSDNIGYLTQCISVFTDANLQNVGIFNNKTSSTELTNPVLIINSTYTGGITITANSPRLAILNKSSINLITVAEGIEQDWIYIGGGSSVDLADISATNSMTFAHAQVNGIYLPFQRGIPSVLGGIYPNSHIGNVFVSPGSYYGGIINYDPQAVCSSPVTELQTLDITHDAIELTWTLPASFYLFITVFYRETGSMNWIESSSEVGYYVQNEGYVFNKLSADTYYDFLVRTKCNNGGIADATITAKTVCCGSDNPPSGYKFCQIVILINNLPAGEQVLCNGVTIDKNYPPGATITISYLGSVYASLVSDFVLDNVPYQLMPYNRAAGRWDASTTPIGSFYDGSVITVGVSIPA